MSALSAFVAGMNIMAAFCCGIEWIKGRERILAVFFWLNLIFAGLNAYSWLT
jgi:hypothetical protein